MERSYVIDVHVHPAMDYAHPELPKLFKSHYPFDPTLPLIASTTKAVYLIRDPIDVMMSAWDFGHLINGSDRDLNSPAFQEFRRNWLETGGAAFPISGSWVAHVRSWLEQSVVPTHLVRYSDLVDSPARELDAILAFLEIDVAPQRRRIAIERSSMSAMAAVENKEFEQRIEGMFFNSSTAAGLQRGHRFVNKGYRGSYDRFLTERERATADATFGPEITRYIKPQT